MNQGLQEALFAGEDAVAIDGMSESLPQTQVLSAA